MSNIRNISSSVPKDSKSTNKLMKNINPNTKNLTSEEFKFFFKRYHRNKNSIKIMNESETDSTFEELPESTHELNSIYLRNLNNLNNFLQKANNLRGITLRGNRLLENISLNKFNAFFREYGKNIEKKLKKHVLKFFYPNNNRPKLMGQKMNLTPIPVKRNIYLKNEKEKKDYKNAERAAVILRRLEYTHGLGNKINKDEKILFYLMKGAALIIEDWWINILQNKKKNDDYNTLISKIKNIEQDNQSNKSEKSKKNNRFVFQSRSNRNYNNKKNEKISKNKKNKKISKLNNKNEKLKKNNKIEIIEINLDEEQIKENTDTKSIKDYKDNQTEPRNSATINSKIRISNHSTKNKSGNSIQIKESIKNNSTKVKKPMSVRNILVEENNDNNRIIDINRSENNIDKNKEKKIKPNPIRLIVSKSIVTENKNKENKIINKGFNLNKSTNIIHSSNNSNLNQNIPISNRLDNLIINKKGDLKKSSSAKKFNGSNYKKDIKDSNNKIMKKMDTNKLFDKDYFTSKSPNNIKFNAKYSPIRLDKSKSQKCKVKSQPKIKIKSEDRNQKGSKQKLKSDKSKLELIMENNINLSIVTNDDYYKEKRNKKLNLNISNDITFNNNTFAEKINQTNNNNEVNETNKSIKDNNNLNIDNNTNNSNNSKKNKSINVVSIIGYTLRDDNNNNLMNSENNINQKKIFNIKNNEAIKNDGINKRDETNFVNDEDNKKHENNEINKDYNEINNKIIKNKNDNILINNNIYNNQNEIIEQKEINNGKRFPNEEENIKEIMDINTSNNVIIHIKETNKEEENIEENINDSKKKIFIPEINMNNINDIKNSSSLNNENNNNTKSNENNINSDSKENEEGSFKFNKNSFFFNNSNNVVLVNLDNNSDYDETEIKKINMKKNYYTKYTTNIIKININNTDYNIINKKKEEKEKCLTEKSDLNQDKKSKPSENILESKKGAQSSRQEKESLNIKYKIIQNNNNKNKVIIAQEKTSFDGSVDEIISNHLMKIHNNNNEINKQRIEKAFNNVQLRKSQNLKKSIYNNFDKLDDSNINTNKLKKSKSSEKLIIKNDIDLNKE